MKAKISKIMLWPSRKMNLGNYNTLELNAGVEMVFEIPVDSKSKELQEALDEARGIIKEEFKKQYAPYQKVAVKKENEGTRNLSKENYDNDRTKITN